MFNRVRAYMLNGIERKDDSKRDFMDAIGLSTYSTSNPTVMSYVSIFESLINQIKLYEQLKIYGKLQEEFINIASHELRTPTQTIIAYSDLLQRPENIPDVTKIESKTLMLNKEKFDLSDLLSTTIDNYRNNIEKKNDDDEGKVRLLYTNVNNEPFLVEQITKEFFNLSLIF